MAAGFGRYARWMLSLPNPPDFADLAAAGRELDEQGQDPLRLGLDRRAMPRRSVAGAVFTGVVPRSCERVRLSRVPVTVFKPLRGGWAVNLAPSGVAFLMEQPLELRSRRWVRLDHLATRPTLLPGRVDACEPFEWGARTLSLIRLRFLVENADTADRLGFLWPTVQVPIAA